MKALKTCGELGMSPALSRERHLMSQHHPCPSLQNKGNLERILGTAPTWQDTPKNFWALEKLVRTGGFGFCWKHPSCASSEDPPFPGGGLRAESPRDGSLQTRHHHCSPVHLLPPNRGVFRNFVPIFRAFDFEMRDFLFLLRTAVICSSG